MKPTDALDTITEDLDTVGGGRGGYWARMHAARAAYWGGYGGPWGPPPGPPPGYGPYGGWGPYGYSPRAAYRAYMRGWY
jgi:hypothetical protein